ncbi:unnamed protein product [Aphanomyces euteiches]
MQKDTTDECGEDARREKSAKETTTKRQRHYIRQRDEIRSLRQQIEHLSALLSDKPRSAMTTYDMPLWERTAKEDLAEKNKSLEENQYLREAIYENATFIEQMQLVFHKKPRLTVRFLHSIPSYCPLVAPYRYPLGGMEILQARSAIFTERSGDPYNC